VQTGASECFAVNPENRFCSIAFQEKEDVQELNLKDPACPGAPWGLP
jgi:hypothetical protein